MSFSVQNGVQHIEQDGNVLFSFSSASCTEVTVAFLRLKSFLINK